MYGQSDEYSKRFLHLIIRTVHFLCREGRFGIWGTTRTSGNAIWALSDCGLINTHRDFITYCIRQLFESDDCIRDERGVRFNEEVWDTSVALIALQKSAKEQFTQEVNGMVKWLLLEAQHDNFKNEPWETLWALATFIYSNGRLLDSELVKRCISWILGRRSAEGTLISPHYMGFLLMILNSAVHQLDLPKDEINRYSEAIFTCESYLKSEFLKNKEQGILWGNEPWMVGHILLGIAGSPNAPNLFFRDADFNNCLLNWYEQLEWRPTGGGWLDLVETSFTLIGLTNYYQEREVFLSGEAARADIVKQIASRITFRFHERSSLRMTVYPIWHARKFKPVKNLCFVIMPFHTKRSAEVYGKLVEIIRYCGLTAKRADQIYRPDIMEDVWSSINECGIVIADCSGRNANVFYELGIAQTLGKDVIILTQKEKDIPFDIQRFRYIKYENNESGYNILKEKLPEYINAILKGQ